jgi:hypothetical protein
MNEQSKNINPYSLEDIERYLQGKLSSAEMHELEKAAVQDPFLADAIEGYQSIGQGNLKEDLNDIHARLSSGPAKLIPAAAKQNTWWRVAAAVIVLAGAGILGFKIFTGKNNTQELAKTESIAATQKETATALDSKIDTTASLQKNTPVASNRRPLSSLQESTITASSASPNNKNLQPVAALPARQKNDNATVTAKDTMLFDQLAARDMVAANRMEARTSGLLAQTTSAREMAMQLNKAIDPALAGKKDQINFFPNRNSMTVSGTYTPLSAGKGKKIKGDTINLDHSEMPVFTQAGYIKTTQSAITALGNSSTLTVSGNDIAKKRSGISVDTLMFTDQKKMYVTLNETKPPTSSATINLQLADAVVKKTGSLNVGAQRPNTSLAKNDSAIALLPEVSVAGYGGVSKRKELGSVPSPDTRKDLSRPVDTAPDNNAEKGTVSNFGGSSIMVLPVSGWYDFTRYLAGKIAAKKNIGEHGTVEIKMNISESGKVSKVRILKSFNTQLDPILIKAIRKGPRWKSTDYLKKKDFVFKVDL